MPKGYWIPHLDINNPEGFNAYRTNADAWHEHNGSKLLARAGQFEVMEGKARSRNVMPCRSTAPHSVTTQCTWPRVVTTPAPGRSAS